VGAEEGGGETAGGGKVVFCEVGEGEMRFEAGDGERGGSGGVGYCGRWFWFGGTGSWRGSWRGDGLGYRTRSGVVLSGEVLLLLLLLLYLTLLLLLLLHLMLLLLLLLLLLLQKLLWIEELLLLPTSLELLLLNDLRRRVPLKSVHLLREILLLHLLLLLELKLLLRMKTLRHLRMHKVAVVAVVVGLQMLHAVRTAGKADALVGGRDVARREGRQERVHVVGVQVWADYRRGTSIFSVVLGRCRGDLPMAMALAAFATLQKRADRRLRTFLIQSELSVETG
jgi:hypothetical protein